MNQITTDFLIAKKISDFESTSRLCANRITQASNLIDLRRAAGAIPSAPGFIAWSPDVKRATFQTSEALARKVKTLVDARLEHLDHLFETENPDFQLHLGQFQRDLRYLGSHAPKVVRAASTHIWSSYRFTSKPVDSSNPKLSIRQYTPARTAVGGVTEGDLKFNEILCPSEIVIGQTFILGTRLADGAVISIIHHAGRDSYAFSDESRPLSQQFEFGSLRDCIFKLQERMEVTLPSIKVIWYGHGMWEAHERYTTEMENPWKIEPNQRYEVVNASGLARQYMSTTEGHVFRIDVDPINPRDNFNPKKIWGIAEWRSLRQVSDETDLESNALSSRPGAPTHG